MVTVSNSTSLLHGSSPLFVALLISSIHSAPATQLTPLPSCAFIALPSPPPTQTQSPQAAAGKAVYDAARNGETERLEGLLQKDPPAPYNYRDKARL